MNIPPPTKVDCFSEFAGRNMIIVYRYFPDHNGAIAAANYDGLPVLEKFGDFTVTIANKSMTLVRDEIVTDQGKPGDTVDTLFTRWIRQRAVIDGTFTIESYPTAKPPLFDFTHDSYKLLFPEEALGGFFKPANWSQPVTVTVTQTYECPSGTALKGDMPAIVSSSCEGLTPKKEFAEPITPKQKVTPTSP